MIELFGIGVVCGVGAYSFYRLWVYTGKNMEDADREYERAIAKGEEIMRKYRKGEISVTEALALVEEMK